MLFPNGFLLLIAAALASGVICSWLRRRFAANRVVDRPNERSLHTAPVPIGGGIGLWIAALGLWFNALSRANHVDQNFLFILGMVALIIVSWMDDRKPRPAYIRFGVHALAVFLGLAGMDDTQLIFHGALPFWPDRILAGVCWLWFINLMNFMDGIDGISGAQSLHLTAGFVIICQLAGLHAMDEEVLALCIFGASLGFLILNWHPAKIFLGDVGSIPLGYALGYLMLKLALAGPGFLAIAFVLPLYYLCDATFTLFRRIAQRKKVWEAHREHFYQKAALAGAPQAKIVISVIITNMVLLGICVYSLKTGAYMLAFSPLPVLALLWYLKRLGKAAPKPG